MATTTPNFGWAVPTSTDLVKDGAVAIETLGDSIDASLVDLKGGTTGQVLAKASNTDMDFSWVAQDDSNAIQNAIVDAKGDLIAATANDTPARLAVGTNGQVLTADSTAATGLAWATPVVPSVNLLLNSNFALNQRAYVSGDNLSSGTYGFDRWKSNYTNTTLTFTASTQGQSITINASGGLQQVIEQGLVPAGTYTLSWTGTATARVYNSGGTPPSYAASPVTFTADGTANVIVEFTASAATKTLSKVQFNAGTSTTWALATPTLQTELAACQRYYFRITAGADNYVPLTNIGGATSTTATTNTLQLPVTLRAAASSIEYANLSVYGGGTSGFGFLSVSALALIRSSTSMLELSTTVSGATTGAFYRIQPNGAAGYIGVVAEL
jgi:hypothetical protein